MRTTCRRSRHSWSRPYPADPRDDSTPYWRICRLCGHRRRSYLHGASARIVPALGLGLFAVAVAWSLFAAAAVVGAGYAAAAVGVLFFLGSWVRGLFVS